MRTARVSAFAVCAILASANAFADPTPPVITPSLSGTLGSNGWYTSDVTLSWTVTDDESPVLFTSGCDTTTLTNDTSGASFTCSATSAAGTSSVTQTIRRDSSGPDVVFTGNAGTYSVEETIAIFCNTFDPLSGVASTTCGAPLTGLAYTFPLETPVTSFVTATDNAGNTTTATLVFTVDVTAAGVSAIVDRVAAKSSVAKTLNRRLVTIEESSLLGNLTARTRNLNSFIDQVRRETGKNLSQADADLLIRLAGYL